MNKKEIIDKIHDRSSSTMVENLGIKIIDIGENFVSGKMPSYERKIKLDKLKELSEGDRGLLTNARCLSEGVDVPSLDGVAFIDPKGSEIDIVQAVGRSIRLSEEKKIGTIFMPVFIKDADVSVIRSDGEIEQLEYIDEYGIYTNKLAAVSMITNSTFSYDFSVSGEQYDLIITWNNSIHFWIFD